MSRKTVGNVSIAKKFHYATASNGCEEMESFAKVRDAIMSSFSNSGCSVRISEKLIPEAKRSRITSTGHLIPRIHGLPWQISGSTVMRLRRFFGSIKEFWNKIQSRQAKKWTSLVMVCIISLCLANTSLHATSERDLRQKPKLDWDLVSKKIVYLTNLERQKRGLSMLWYHPIYFCIHYPLCQFTVFNTLQEKEKEITWDWMNWK